MLRGGQRLLQFFVGVLQDLVSFQGNFALKSIILVIRQRQSQLLFTSSVLGLQLLGILRILLESLRDFFGDLLKFILVLLVKLRVEGDMLNIQNARRVYVTEHQVVQGSIRFIGTRIVTTRRRWHFLLVQ